MRILSTVFLALLFAQIAVADPEFADIISVDAKKGTIVYKLNFAADNKDEKRVQVPAGCEIRNGYFLFGKPAVQKVGDEIPGGLKNAVFAKVSASNPLRVNLYFAEKADKEKGVSKGDLIKILVNPKDE